MSLLDANADSLRLGALNTIAPPSAPPEPGMFSNFGPGAGNAFMRSMASLGRAGSMAASAIPVAVDWAVDPYSPTGEALGLKDKPLADRYFKWHDEFFGKAVDYWTPKPHEVGAAGQIVGQLAGGLAKFLASPGLAVADAQLSTGEDLVRQGVDAGTAQEVGAISGISTAVGIRAPAAVGNTLTQRVLSGAAINVAQSAVATEAQRLTLGHGGAPAPVVAQFDPLDLKGRTIDALMGLAFGGVAHYQAKAEFSAVQRDAIMLANQARALELGSLPGKPATPGDLTTAVDHTKLAMDQMARGQPVDVPGQMPRFEHDPSQAADRAEIASIAQEPGVPKPIARPAMLEPEAPKPAEPGAKPSAEPALPRFDDTVRVPTGEFDPATGDPKTASANEFIARAHADVEQVKTTAPGLFKAAAECLLGSI